MNELFLPVSAEELRARGWEDYDVLLVTGDAYVDHPSFGAAVIGRVIEAEGLKVAVLAQPDWKSPADFAAMGRPKLAVMVTGGNIDSMVAHYTAAKKPRSEDSYSPGGKAGHRPDRACLVYAQRAREAFPGLPLILGGLEASLRRFAHYDYWDDKVRRSLLTDAKADLLVYGMGELAVKEICLRLSSGEPVSALTDIPGTCCATAAVDDPTGVVSPSFEAVLADKAAYAEATMLQYGEQDAVRGKTVFQAHGNRFVKQNKPARPLTTAELDAVAALPYARTPHPMYPDGVPAIEEVQFSLIHNRGCFGSCHFCSLHFHQGRMISVRSHNSLLKEAGLITKMPGFKGYIHDVGGPTANFRHPSCQRQLKDGLCRDRACLAPKPCPKLDADHTDFIALLRKLREVPGVKKVFVRSGLRYDYLMLDPSGECLPELVKHHISGQLKVAPEHCVDGVLYHMGKPPFEVYRRFAERYRKLNGRYEKQQFLVPYLISSHPGCTLGDAVRLAETLKGMGCRPEQVQDFYPTPGTLSTCMYYTGLDPQTMRPVFVPKTPRDKAHQRALLQWWRPEKRRIVLDALRQAGREDLIGFSKHCLVRPEGGSPGVKIIPKNEKPSRPAGKPKGRKRP